MSYRRLNKPCEPEARNSIAFFKGSELTSLPLLQSFFSPFTLTIFGLSTLEAKESWKIFALCVIRLTLMEIDRFRYLK